MKITKKQINLGLTVFSLVLIGLYFTFFYVPKSNVADIHKTNVENLEQWISKANLSEKEFEEYLNKKLEKEATFERVYKQKKNEIEGMLPTNLSKSKLLNTMERLSQEHKVDLKIENETSDSTTYRQNVNREKVFNGINLYVNSYIRKTLKTGKSSIDLSIEITNNSQEAYPLINVKNFKLKTNNNEYDPVLKENDPLKSEILSTKNNKIINLTYKIDGSEMPKEVIVTTDKDNTNNKDSEDSDNNGPKQLTQILLEENTTAQAGQSGTVKSETFRIGMKGEYHSIMLFMYKVQNLEILNKVDNFTLEYNDQIFNLKDDKEILDQYKEFPLKATCNITFYHIDKTNQ